MNMQPFTVGFYLLKKNFLEDIFSPNIYSEWLMYENWGFPYTS